MRDILVKRVHNFVCEVPPSNLSRISIRKCRSHYFTTRLVKI